MHLKKHENPMEVTRYYSIIQFNLVRNFQGGMGYYNTPIGKAVAIDLSTKEGEIAGTATQREDIVPLASPPFA